jgi:cytochrome oxidase Cu insertion factor (SCO1/SenC/PrrC family)
MKHHALRFQLARAGFLFLMSVTAGTLPAQPVLSGKPVYGGPVVFQYRPPEARNAMVRPIREVTLLLYGGLSQAADTLPMKPSGDSTWKAVYTLTDTTGRVLYFAFRIQDDAGRVSTDDNGGALYDVLVCGSDGRPVQGAHEARALSYTGITDRRPENLDRALSEAQQELVFYPRNLSARNVAFTLMLKQSGYSESTRAAIAGQIRSLLGESPGSEAVMRFAVSAYRMIDRKTEADQLEKELVGKFPKGDEAARKALSDIMQEKDARPRLERLDKFRNEFPNSSMDEFALGQIVTASIETDDTEKMVRTGDLLLQKAAGTAGANALAALALVFADRNTGLDKAEMYARKALSIAAAQPFETESKDQKARTEGRYHDVLGWVLLQKGDIPSARPELEKAVAMTFQANVYFHSGVLEERSGNAARASEFYGKGAAFGGQTGGQSRKALASLWMRTGRDTLQLPGFVDTQRGWVEAKNREMLLAKRISRPAPDFKLEDVSGGSVRLSSQRGNPVLLCFWASWSQASLRVLEELQALADLYGKDVLFMTVSTDPEKPGLKKLPNGDRFFLPVLVGNGIEKSYGLEGVPMIYVIDKNGQIRFETRGFRPDLQQTLEVQLEDVLGPRQ